MKLNLGCGRDIRDGWVNVDQVAAPGVDHVIDLDDRPAFPWADDTFTELAASHVIEHLRHPLPLFAEAWRVAAPDALLTVRCPYGSSDDADEDPTHVRRLFLGSWGYFSQPFYWRADYGYRGDWQPETVTLRLKPFLRDVPDDELPGLIQHSRNVVDEMVATLRAVKPARQPLRELQTPARVTFAR